MRGEAKLTWVKFHINGWLHGSIRWQLSPEERGVWADLIILAGQCLKGGRIEDNDGRGLPRDYIANQLNVPLKLLNETIEKCVQEGRVELDGDIIIISHWTTYQSEYERQRQYRQKKDNLPDWIDKETWSAFTEMRTKLKAPLTERAKDLIIGRLGKFKDAGDDPNEILKQSIMNSWKGVFPLKEAHATNRNPRELPKTYPDSPDYPELS